MDILQLFCLITLLVLKVFYGLNDYLNICLLFLNNVINLNYSFFWKKKILRILNKMDIKKIQNLNIWNNEFTKLVYKKKTNMLPRISVFEILKLFLFYVKSSILIIIK